MGALEARWKAGVIRGYREALKDRGLLDDVVRAASRPTARLLEDPPLPTQWFGADHLTETLHAIREVQDEAELKVVCLEAGRLTLAPLVEPLLGGMLRVHGVNPATLLDRVDLLMSRLATGYSLWLKRESAQSVVMAVSGPQDRLLQLHWCGLFTELVRIAGFDGSCTPRGLDAFRITWAPSKPKEVRAG